MKQKLVFVLPSYDKDTSTHFAHTLDFIDEVGKYMQLFLFIEDAKGYPKLNHVQEIYCQKYRFFLTSFIERFIVLALLRLKGYKNIYVHYSYWSAVIGGLIYKSTFGKLYYWHCEMYEKYGSDKKWWDIKWKILDDLPLRFCLKFCSFFVTGTKLSGEYYTREFKVNPKKIKIIPNSINLNRFNSNTEKIKKQIVFVHWLSPRKGADLLPAIIAGSQKINPNLYFVIIGGGPLKNYLSKEFKDNKNVKMLGALSNENVRKQIAKSRVLIMPSRQEGFPRVILEAMALGTPFVATEVGGLKDIVPKTVNLIPSEDINAFTNEIIDLISDSKRMDMITNSCLKKVQEFSLEQVAKLFVSNI